MSEEMLTKVGATRLNDDEVRRRLAQCYALILSCANADDTEETANGPLAQDAPLAASPPAHESREQSGGYHDE